MTRTTPTYARSRSLGAAAAQITFIVSFLALGAAEGHGYDPMRQDISDLGALTAHHATIWRLLLLVTGAVTIAFGLLVVRPVLRSTAAGVLVALSLVGFDNFTDFFFRLDCRAADPGCGASEALGSWHGVAHVVCFGIAALATMAAPFVMAHAMIRHADWSAMARPTWWFGVVTIALLAITMAASGTPVQGLAQRIASTVIPLGLAAFAVAVARREPRFSRTTDLLIGGR